MMLGPPLLLASDVVSITRYNGRVHTSNNSANVRLRVIYQKSDDNRSLAVECDSGSFYRASEMPISEKSPVEILFEFNLEKGLYECTAILYRRNDKQFRTRISVLMSYN